MQSLGAEILGRLGLEHPIVCAPMAGGLAGSRLAAAVSRAGALGSVGMLSPDEMVAEIAVAKREAPGRPVAAGLLVRFMRPAHVEAMVHARPRAVVLHDGRAPAAVRRLRAAGMYVMHQVGSVAQAEQAVVDGADALIAQGYEAGGHLVGEVRGEALLPAMLAVAGERPVLVAGGVARAEDVRAALRRGAAAVVLGTRFLCTDESGAHPRYRERVLGAERTIVTRLFGVGWSLRHRVVPNEATRRYCRGDDGEIAGWLKAVQWASDPIGRRMAFRRPGPGPKLMGPLLSPEAPRGADDVESAALYAGESARWVREVRGAEDVVRDLSQAT